MKFGGIKPADTAVLEEPTGINLAKLAARYSDGVIYAADGLDAGLKAYCEGLSVPILSFHPAAMEDGTWLDEYNAFYDKV